MTEKLRNAAKDVLEMLDNWYQVRGYQDVNIVKALRQALADHIPDTGKMVAETNELLPCPFCGGDAVVTDWRVMHSVDCTVCKVHVNGERANEFLEEPSDMYVEYLRLSAIQAWNTRVKPPFHPSQLFTKGTTGSFMVNGFQLRLDDGELVGANNVAWHPSISDYETLKQERDRYRKALEDIYQYHQFESAFKTRNEVRDILIKALK